MKPTVRLMRIALAIVFASAFMPVGAMPSATAARALPPTLEGATPRQANGASDQSTISFDNGDIAFSSFATNLAAGAATGISNIYLLPQGSDEHVLLTRGYNGEPANGNSSNPKITADGQTVVFQSDASNLVPSDTNGKTDIFVWSDGDLSMVTRAWYGPNTNGNSTNPSISLGSTSGTTARIQVVFQSDATNLVTNDGNGKTDIFSVLLGVSAIELVSKAPDGSPANGASTEPAISPENGFIAFASEATNLVAGDTNGLKDVFGRAPGESIALASVGLDGPANGPSGSPTISAWGTLAFVTEADNIVPGDTNGVADIVMIADGGAPTRVSLPSTGIQTDGPSRQPVAHAFFDRVVAFTSSASTLAGSDQNGSEDVFWYLDGEIQRISSSAMSADPNGSSYSPATGGNALTYTSTADDLVPADTNGLADIFLVDGSATEPDATIVSRPRGATESIYGMTQMDTSAEIARMAFPDGADYVIVAKGDHWADALVGAPLAAVYEAPILLATGDELAPNVKNAITELGATHAIVLGGERAVRPTIVADLATVGIPEANVERIFGVTMYDTADKIAKRVLDTLPADTYDGWAFFATGASPYDALSVSAIAADAWGPRPIFLVDRTATQLTPGARAEIDSGRIQRSVAVGGTKAIPDSLFEQMSTGRNRFNGDTWWETSLAIADLAYSMDYTPNRPAFARGDVPYDALAGAVLQGRRRSPLITVKQHELPIETRDDVTNSVSLRGLPDAITFLGGTKTLTPPVREAIEMAIWSPDRWGW